MILMIFAAAQIKSNFYLFTDDSNLPYADKNLKSFDTEVVNTELHNLYIWLTSNKSTLITWTNPRLLFSVPVKRS